MIKKIDAYQTKDGKIFTGEDAKKDAENWDHNQKIVRMHRSIIAYSREVFEIPELYKDGEPSEPEQEICDCMDVVDFDDITIFIMNLRRYNPSGFDKLVEYLKEVQI